jgi:hypothetical protein
MDFKASFHDWELPLGDMKVMLCLFLLSAFLDELVSCISNCGSPPLSFRILLLYRPAGAQSVGAVNAEFGTEVAVIRVD